MAAKSLFFKKFGVFFHIAIFLLIYSEGGNIQCSCGFLQAQYQDDISFLFTFFPEVRVEWQIVQVPTVYEAHLIRLSRFANHRKCPTAELQSATKSHFKTS